MQNKYRIFLFSLLFVAFFALSFVAIPYAAEAFTIAPVTTTTHSYADMPPAQNLRLPGF